MEKNTYYKANDKMSDLICGNYVLLQVMSRFGLSLGFGDRTVEEVCKSCDVDCNTFLTVVNFIVGDNEYIVDKNSKISIKSLMSYLREAHHYFLEYQLPSIRVKLNTFLEYSEDKEVSFLIINFFDAYMEELQKHMGYEEKYVFTYVDDLMQNKKDCKFKISEFASSHNQVDTKLTELKDIIIKYLHTSGNNYATNSMLFEIFACIEDLDSHSRVEDCMFVPAVLNLEKQLEAV